MFVKFNAVENRIARINSENNFYLLEIKLKL